MDLKDKKIGFAMCGSFCTFKRVIVELEKLAATGAQIIPIMSDFSANTDTRFGTAEFFRSKVEQITNKQIITDIQNSEPIGPKKLLDALVIMPCTGNSLAKIASGIADTSVTMAAKSHLRNQKPILIGVSTNDGLGTAFKNISALMNTKNIYFIPFMQDDYINKPNSIVADFELLIPALEKALDKQQLQPVFRG